MTDNQELNNLIEELTADPDLYVSLKDLTVRFVEIDDEFNHRPWNLLQIFSQLQIMVPKRIGNNIVKEMLESNKKSIAKTQLRG